MSQIIGKIKHYIQKGIPNFFNVVQEFLMQLYPWPKSGEFRTFAEL